MSMLYKTYQDFLKNNLTGFSTRLPDYAFKYWLNQLESAINKSTKKNFLDIGAGNGRLSFLLSKIFENGTSIEVQVDKNSWNKILKTCNNVNLIEGELQKKIDILSSENFDFVILAEVFEHIPEKDVSSFLTALQKILSENGKIFLTTPNALVQGSAQDSPIWHEKFLYGHHKHYSFDELKKLFKKYDFEVESCIFECGKIKKKFYNKIFYPISRLDYKFLNSKKIPFGFRKIYEYFSFPFVMMTRIIFLVFSKGIIKIEEKFNKENNAATMMLLIKRG